MRKSKEKKQPLGITEEFIAEVRAASRDDLKSNIVLMQKQKRESEVFLKEEPAIIDKKDELKTMQAPAKETIKVLNNRTKHILDALREMGAL